MTNASKWLPPLVQACKLCQKPPATFHFTHNFSKKVDWNMLEGLHEQTTLVNTCMYTTNGI